MQFRLCGVRVFEDGNSQCSPQYKHVYLDMEELAGDPPTSHFPMFSSSNPVVPSVPSVPSAKLPAAMIPTGWFQHVFPGAGWQAFDTRLHQPSSTGLFHTRRLKQLENHLVLPHPHTASYARNRQLFISRIINFWTTCWLVPYQNFVRFHTQLCRIS